MGSTVLIEKYRGFDIEFNPVLEKFVCVLSDEHSKESISFSAIKKAIDDYKKSNQDFKPFWVEPNPIGRFTSRRLKVIGVRKDGRFVAENENGGKEQISDYNLYDYILVDASNEEATIKLQELKAKEESQRLENNNARKEILSQMKIVTLGDFKESIK